MRIAHFFIDRPRFAVVVSCFLTLIGVGALFSLPVAPYPDIVPPTVDVTTSYPGASATTLAQTVATPLEQQINGVENMLYMSSQSTGDGKLDITVTFALGTDLNVAQNLVQNRVQNALPHLPEDVQRLGVQVRKKSPNILLAIHFYSPDNSRDPLYLSNYTTLQVQDELARVAGVGDVQAMGARDYAMRIWVDPAQAASRNLSADEIYDAIRAQNQQVSAGVLNEPPTQSDQAYQINIQAKGRLVSPAEFGNIVLKSDSQGRVTRLRDVARIEIGAADYGTIAYMDRSDAVALIIYGLPGANSVQVEHSVLDKMKSLSQNFPTGVGYKVIYDPTTFISQSVDEVIRTIFEAIILVVIVVFVFLQNWRATLIPVAAIPISLLGSAIILKLFGISVNNLSLFGWVLAVGIVVDDAIVVVENVERNMRAGMSAYEAAHRTMDEVAGALLAIALTLCAVFVPAAFLSGISGQFFRQFAATIAASTIISCIVSLTLSPALSALLFRNHKPGEHAELRGPRRWLQRGFDSFNRGFDRLSNGYGRLTGRLARMLVVVLVVYVGLIALTGVQLARTPAGFIPEQDQGYLIALVQLPPGASLARTEAVVKRVTDLALTTPGIEHTAPFVGFDALTSTVASNTGTVFIGLPSLYGRHEKGATAADVLAKIRQRLSVIRDGVVITVMPPPVQGLGSAGGFKMMLEDKAGLGSGALAAAAGQLAGAANQNPALQGVFPLFNTGSPSLFVDIDRVKAEKLDVAPQAIFDTLQTYMGSRYVNDFNYLGRTYQVLVQAKQGARQTASDIAMLRVKNADGAMVPLGEVVQIHDETSPYRVPRYNLYPAAEILGGAAPGVASGTALQDMEALAHKVLPRGIDFEWTDLAFQQQLPGTPAWVIFGAAALFCFLVLVAQYESWNMPLAIMLIVPMCLLASVTGLRLRGMPVDILAQIGFVVLIGLAAKNAILIVEFARQREHEPGVTFVQAAIHAARTRLRPILMTSLAFILGVLPLTVASGAGAEMRQALGTAVFFGMLGVTAFGLIFTPALYIFIRRLGVRKSA